MRHALIPCLRYRDARGAIDFLGAAFGFVERAVHADPDDPAIVHHAELLLNGNMIMLGSARNDAARALYRWRSPVEAGGVTASIYAVVDDPDAHHARAAAAGAEVIRGPYDNIGYPGRGYDARDPEGNVWSFGNYDPFAEA